MKRKKAITLATLVVFILSLFIAGFLVKSIWEMDVLRRIGISTIGGAAGLSDSKEAVRLYYEGDFARSQQYAQKVIQDAAAHEYHEHMQLRIALCRSAVNDYRGSITSLERLKDDYSHKLDGATMTAIDDLIAQARQATRETNQGWRCCDIRGLGKIWVHGICPQSMQAASPCDENKPVVADAQTI